MNNNYLVHHGVKGMRWGVRKYVNPDGTMTEKGKKRYGSKEGYVRSLKKTQTAFDRILSVSAGAIAAATAIRLIRSAQVRKGQIAVGKLMRARKAEVLVDRITDVTYPVAIVGLIAASAKAGKVRESGSEKQSK